MFGELPAGSLTKVGTCRHTITHHRLEVNVYTGKLKDCRRLRVEGIRRRPGFVAHEERF